MKQMMMVQTQPFDMADLSPYFQLPEKVVAKELGICLTSLKKLCRQQGINRWPYRKVDNFQKLGTSCLRLSWLFAFADQELGQKTQ